MANFDDTRVNLLDTPSADAPTETHIKHRLAVILAASGFPIEPEAGKSNHPSWNDYDRISHINRGSDWQGKPVDGKIVAVYTVDDVEWSEFMDSYVGNSEHYGLVGEAVAADGWVGRISVERDFHELLAELVKESV